jgi:DNA-binding transcriptional LysR family regulator
VALSGRFVCVLPDVVAEADFRAGRLRRLPPTPVPDTDVFAACRAEDAQSSFTADVIQRVERAFARVPRPGPAPGPGRTAARGARKQPRKR